MIDASLKNIESDSRLQRRSDAINNLLRDRDESVKAHVLEYIVKYDIDPENEFFIIFIALGTIERFLKKSPEEIEEVFALFNQEISQWSQTNLETLKHISQKASITEKLASNSESLGDNLMEFLKVCEQLIEQLQISNKLQKNSLSQLESSAIELEDSVLLIEKKISQLNSATKNLAQDIEGLKNLSIPEAPRWTWKDNILSLILVCMVFLCGSQFFQYRSHQVTNIRVRWLLEKANRQDCLSGVINPESSECQSY